MDSTNHKLYSLDDVETFFDYKRFFVKLPQDLLPPTKNKEKIKTEELYKLATRVHEYQHYYNIIGTPMGIYDTLVRFSCMTEITFSVRRFIRKQQKVRLPFEQYLNEFPTAAFVYRLSKAMTAFFYCIPKGTALEGIKYIDKMGVTEWECENLWKATGDKIRKSFPSLVLKLNKNGTTKHEYIPIGLSPILEGFSRIIQDHHILSFLPAKQYAEILNKRMVNSDYTPYYILFSYAYNKLNGLNFSEIEMIVALSFYLSLMFLKPISQLSDFYGFYGVCLCDHLDERAVNFISSLEHPGHTFLKALFALKEIAEEKGGVPLHKKEIANLLNQTCDRMDIPPVRVLYSRFESFLNILINKIKHYGFQEYPFAKHYFEISYKFMKTAKNNLYDSIFAPGILARDKNAQLRPMIFCGDIVSNYHDDKYDWLYFTSIMDQFLHKKRIFCPDKFIWGRNSACKNDKECSFDKIDYPYSKCESDFIDMINIVLGDANKLIPS